MSTNSFKKNLDHGWKDIGKGDEDKVVQSSGIGHLACNQCRLSKHRKSHTEQTFGKSFLASSPKKVIVRTVVIPKQTKLRSINVFDKIIHVASLPACQYANKNSSACFSMFSLEYKESERSSNRDIPNALKSSVWCGNIKGKTKRKLFKPETSQKTIWKRESFIQNLKRGESHQEKSGHLLLPYSAKKRPRRWRPEGYTGRTPMIVYYE